MSNFITIDPGITGTGIAGFISSIHTPIFTANVYPINEKDEWTIKGTSIVNQTRELLKTFLTQHPIVYIEKPQFFKSHRGLTAADSDSLVKLAYIFGRLWECCVQLGKIINCVSIPEWKGQLDKKIVNNRISKILGDSFKFTDHIIDAVGIGLFIKGLF